MQLGLNKLPWYGQILLFAIIGGGGIFAYHYFFGSNLREQLRSKEAQLAREHQEIAKGRAAEKRIVEFRAELAELEARFETLKTVLPEQRDVADMLRRIQMLATQSSLVVKAFRPQAVASKQLHQEWPMTIELDGTYHSLARFFDQVSKVPRIINVGGISIKAKPEQDTTDGTTITALCTATTFVLLDKPQPVKKPGRPGVPAAVKPPTAAP
jgi:Tfp pilus assembly protein PilO